MSLNLSGWESSMRLRGDTEGHVVRQVALCQQLLALVGIKSLVRFRSVHVIETLGSGARGWTAHQVARRVAAVKAFSRWLFVHQQTVHDEMVSLAVAKPEKTVFRRAMTDDELDGLMATTRVGKARCGMTGRHRAATYALAAGTGLRLNEIRTLTPESFSLDEQPPSVRVEQRHAKNRKVAELPLYDALADEVRPWVATTAPGSRVFPLPMGGAARLLRADMMAGGINTKGLDFHALRVTFCTRLARNGVSLQMAQRLMRHSDPKLTVEAYTRLTLQDAAAAVATLNPHTIKATERLLA